MAEDTTTNNSNNSNSGACVVCYRNVEIYSIGMCEHPVCYECSTRMRVLCKQNECPICRQDLPKVVFTMDVKPFRHIRRGNLLDTRYNIYFENVDIQEKFTQLLSHACDICEEKQVFSSFNSLKDHMRRKHELHYCDLCVENLKIFSCERRCYTRADLAHHRRKGDVDDKSHKGHPLCEFCDCRYMDNDELFRHLRRDHLYCHFCDADGLHQYYSSYDYLRDHFRQEHYLCEEGPCHDEKFTSVFRTDIDLKAHKASVHGKHLGKAAAKQARTLELEFTLAPRGDNRNNRRGPMAPGPSNSRNRDYVDARDFQEPESVFFNEPEAILMRQPDVKSTEEFPSLGNSSLPPTISQSKSKGRGNLTIRGSLNSQPLAVTDENFPALGPESPNPGVSKTVNLNVYSTNRSQSTNPTGTQRPKSSTPNVSIQVNHKTDGSITTRVSGPNVRIRPAQLKRDSDFPALGRNEPSTSSNSAQWTKITCIKPSTFKERTGQTQVSKNPTPPPPAAASPSPVFTDAFPSLPKSTKNKKQSSITVSTNNDNTSASSSTYAGTWNRSLANESETSATIDANKANTKKKKKKKVKQTSSGNNSSGNESTASKLNLQRDNNPSNVSIANDNTVSASRILKQQNNDNDKIKRDKKLNQSGCSSSTTNPSNTALKIDNESTSTTNGIRKRSELKIDNLMNTNNSRKIIDDFPALGKTIKAKLSNPPPGFGTTTPPPPGFAVKLNNTEQLSNDNVLTFTNSSGESFTILPDNANDKNNPYLPPIDFQKRNKNLVSKISKVLDNQRESMEEFRYLSGLFRQGTLSVEHYYKRCRSAMGNDEFSNVFPEMLVLLPDISKQRELYDLHKNEIGNIKGISLCDNCGQVVKIGNDMRLHMSSHTMENHFPALGEPTTTQTTNTWVRKGT